MIRKQAQGSSGIIAIAHHIPRRGSSSNQSNCLPHAALAYATVACEPKIVCPPWAQVGSDVEALRGSRGLGGVLAQKVLAVALLTCTGEQSSRRAWSAPVANAENISGPVIRLRLAGWREVEA